MNILCKIFGHKKTLEDVAGGTLFEVCSRPGCSWIGRCVYDAFADEFTKAEIIEGNKNANKKVKQ